MKWKAIEEDTKGCPEPNHTPTPTPNLEVTVYSSNYHSFVLGTTLWKHALRQPRHYQFFNVCAFRHSWESLSTKFPNILKATELLANKFQLKKKKKITCRKQSVFKMSKWTCPSLCLKFVKEKINIATKARKLFLSLLVQNKEKCELHTLRRKRLNVIYARQMARRSEKKFTKASLQPSTSHSCPCED